MYNIYVSIAGIHSSFRNIARESHSSGMVFSFGKYGIILVSRALFIYSSDYHFEIALKRVLFLYIFICGLNTRTHRVIFTKHEYLLGKIKSRSNRF